MNLSKYTILENMGGQEVDIFMPEAIDRHDDQSLLGARLFVRQVETGVIN